MSRPLPFRRSDDGDVFEVMATDGSVHTVIFCWELQQMERHLQPTCVLDPEWVMAVWAYARRLPGFYAEEPLSRESVSDDRCEYAAARAQLQRELEKLVLELGVQPKKRRALTSTTPQVPPAAAPTRSLALPMALRLAIIRELNDHCLLAGFPACSYAEFLLQEGGSSTSGAPALHAGVDAECSAGEAAPPRLRASLLQQAQLIKRVEFDAAVLQRSALLGTRQLPVAAPIVTAASCIEGLLDDREVRPLGELAQSLRALTHLPDSPDCHGLRTADAFSVDGVQGVSQRGALQRLLLSELAHDDEMLAHRIALYEALYVERESPPRVKERLTTVLLDSGVRMWGGCRFVAAAVALAHSANAEASRRVQSYRCDISRVEGVDLTTPAGLVEHLSAICSTLHPGGALESWLQQREQLNPTQGNSHEEEVLLVTSATTFEDREFRAICHECRPRLHRLYIATVNRVGDYALWQLEPTGERLLQKMRVPLSAALSKITLGVATDLSAGGPRFAAECEESECEASKSEESEDTDV